MAQDQKDLRIKQIEEALRYADEAKITQPQIQQTQDVTQDTMFLLGSDALKIDDTERSDASTGLFSGLLPDEADTTGY
ncbi:regulator of length of O-antigen component of lipopolysaccharide chains [Salmonella enterica subsp. houtenae]|nr:regulator of length of O-antigen component of lipopolysaccharide chains [Salmonella enterica subsp. houtenae]